MLKNHDINQQSYNPKGMGRWASQVLQGKQGIKTRVVSVYVSIVARTHRDKRNFCQQQTVLLSMGIKDHVIKVFWQDFWKEVNKWIANGEQLIIGGDWNCKVKNKKFLEDFEKRELLPVNVNRLSKDLPLTYNNGSYEIDEIFISSTLKVTNAGYLQFGSNLADHYPLWIDVTKDSLLGLKFKLKPVYAARKLKTNDPQVVYKYLSLLQEKALEYNLLRRSHYLLNSVNGELTEKQQAFYEALDGDKEEAMSYTEARCRKLKMGNVAWSPVIQKIRDKIQYFSLAKQRKLGRRVGAQLLVCLGKRTKCNATHLSIIKIKEQLDALFKEYRKLKAKQHKLCENFLDSLAEALEKAGKGKKAKHIKRITTMENQRMMFRKLAAINQKSPDLSIKSTMITKKDGTKSIVTDKRKMETAIINKNRKKYHQTENSCPFMCSPLKDEFGHLGIGPSTDAVLQGDYTPSHSLSAQTQQYIQLCKLPQEELLINPLTKSLDYFIKSWKRMRERTTSRGNHFGHYKAATSNTDIMNIHYNMAKMPIRSGYSPMRWQSETNVMILKKEQVNRLDKMRTLVLFESDFNHNNKFLGRKIMEHLMDNNKIVAEQYSKPGKKCSDHVVNRRLFFDNVQYLKTSAAMAAVDLRSCYN